MFQRLLQCLALLAVLSPLCCCDAAQAEARTAVMRGPMEAHACCGQTEAPAAPREDHDCPHQTASGSLQSFLDDFHLGGSPLLAVPVAMLPPPLFELPAEQLREADLVPPQVEPTGPPGPPPSHILHCRFLL